MPLYEYKCDNCGSVFEVIQKFSDNPLSVHEACGGPVHRLISPSALQFKGSGWYITDYGKSGRGPNGSSKHEGEGKEGKESKESKETKSGGESTTSKTESKPAAPSTSSTSEK
jgi:putative FmdB family regulatory protein